MKAVPGRPAALQHRRGVGVLAAGAVLEAQQHHGLRHDPVAQVVEADRRRLARFGDHFEPHAQHRVGPARQDAGRGVAREVVFGQAQQVPALAQRATGDVDVELSAHPAGGARVGVRGESQGQTDDGAARVGARVDPQADDPGPGHVGGYRLLHLHGAAGGAGHELQRADGLAGLGRVGGRRAAAHGPGRPIAVEAGQLRARVDQEVRRQGAGRRRREHAPREQHRERAEQDAGGRARARDEALPRRAAEKFKPVGLLHAHSPFARTVLPVQYQKRSRPLLGGAFGLIRGRARPRGGRAPRGRGAWQRKRLAPARTACNHGVTA